MITSLRPDYLDNGNVQSLAFAVRNAMQEGECPEDIQVRMHILSDALEDAGCTDHNLLVHLRDTSIIHCRGCPSLNTILGLPEDYEDVQVIVVDYDLPLQEAIALPKFSWINDDITEEHFPKSEDEHGKREIGFKLFRFKKSTDFTYVIGQMRKKNYRPATLREGIPFVRANHELQQKYHIISLGSLWHDYMFSFAYATEFWSYSGNRRLDPIRVNCWDRYDLFLAAAK